MSNYDKDSTPKSITPSGFFGTSSENIVEIKKGSDFDGIILQENNIIIDESLIQLTKSIEML